MADVEQEIATLKKRVAGRKRGKGLPFARWRNDPLGLADAVLGLKAIWDGQRKMIELVRDNDRVVIVAGRKVGKSHAIAILAIWWLLTRPGALVFATAPTSRQADGVVFRAVRQLIRNAPQKLPGELFERGDNGWRLPDGGRFVALATNESERLQGYSGPDSLYLIDEASGVNDELIVSILGNVGGGGKVVMTGNPTKLSGAMHDAATRNPLWARLHVPSTDSPNVKAGKIVVPGLATSAWIAERAEDWGESSPLYEAHVLGRFPSQQSDALIGLSLVEEAKARWHAFMQQGGMAAFANAGDLRIGLDVARFGMDLSCACIRRGSVLLTPITWQGLDAVALSQKVLALVDEHAAPGTRTTLLVDSVGVGGPVADMLRQRRDLDVIDVNASESPTDDRYLRRRDELWGRMKDFLKGGGMLPSDPKLEGDLLAVTYSYTPASKIAIEPKEATKARLRRSPDRGDAACLAVFEAPAPFQCGTFHAPDCECSECLSKYPGGQSPEAWAKHLY